MCVGVGGREGGRNRENVCLCHVNDSIGYSPQYWFTSLMEITYT